MTANQSRSVFRARVASEKPDIGYGCPITSGMTEKVILQTKAPIVILAKGHVEKANAIYIGNSYCVA
jgi:hypothetical protein